MSFYAPYIIFALWQLVRGRINSAKSLLIGFIACLVYVGFIRLVDLNSLVPAIDMRAGLYQSILFLLAFGWACLADYLSLKRTAIACYTLSVFQMVMTIDAFNSPDSYTFLYQAYPFVMIVLNVLIIAAGLSEDDLDSVNADSHCGGCIGKKGGGVV